MTQVVLSISRAGLLALGNSAPVRRIAAISPSREIARLGLMLALLQLLDGVLTAIGVNHFGLGAEANLMIRYGMTHYGVVPALIFFKTIALFIITALCMLARNVGWLAAAMKVMIAVYLAAAIVPWCAILCSKVF